MDWTTLSNNLEGLLLGFAMLAGASLVLGLILMAVAIRQIRGLNIPPDASFVEAMTIAPFLVVVVLDLLDFSLDFLSAPIAWLFLTKLGLQPLRGATLVETVIPGTQFIPTMTLAWVLVRLLGPGRAHVLTQIPQGQHRPRS